MNINYSKNATNTLYYKSVDLTTVNYLRLRDCIDMYIINSRDYNTGKSSS